MRQDARATEGLGTTNREYDEFECRRRSRLSPAGREILAELERAASALEPTPEVTLRRAGSLPSPDRQNIAVIFGAMAEETAERQRVNLRGAALAFSAAEAVREAQERERAAGKGSTSSVPRVLLTSLATASYRT